MKTNLDIIIAKLLPSPMLSPSLYSSLSLSLFCNGHCMCSQLSNPYNVANRARCIIGVHGYLTPIISTALLATFARCSPLSLFCNGHCMCPRLSNPYNVASRAHCIIGVHGYLTPIISTALLATFARCSPLSLFCNGHCMCSLLSNPYNVASRARCIIGVHGYLTPIISTALLAIFARCSPLPLFCNGHCMCSWLSNPYNVASRARCIIGVHGYLTPIISTALLAIFARCSPLPLFCNGHCMCSWLSNPYNVASRARCIIGVHGYLTPIISTALLVTFARYSPLPLFSVGHGRDLYKVKFVGYGCWKVILVGIHAQPCSEYVFVALGIYIYLALGILICLAIGLWVWKLDSNCCSFLLSLTAPTPRKKVIGDPVARFAKPFESRPADPVRREVFRQLAANHPDTASTSGWVAPSATLPVTPPPLQKGTEEGASPVVPSKAKGKRSLPL